MYIHTDVYKMQSHTQTGLNLTHDDLRNTQQNSYTKGERKRERRHFLKAHADLAIHSPITSRPSRPAFLNTYVVMHLLEIAWLSTDSC